MRLHLALGLCAGDALRESVAGERVAVCMDPFTEGPCRFDACSDIGDFLRRRRAWWLAGRPTDADVVAGDDDFAAALSRPDAFDSIVIWSADTTSEQLFACWVLSHLCLTPAAPVEHARPLETGRGAFTSVGLQRPEKLRAIRPRRLAAMEIGRAGQVWDDYVKADPVDFASTVMADDIPLADRLVHVFGRYPSRADGLSTWERHLLRRIEAFPGESTARTVGSVLALKLDETPDDIGDMTLFDYLVELSRAGILAMTGDGREMRSTGFAMTDLGRDVLAGRANRVTEAGFDRWIGGTHLDARQGGLWWHADASLEWSKVPEGRTRG